VLGYMIKRLVWAAVLFLVVTLYTYVLFFMIGPVSLHVGARGAGESGEASNLADTVGVQGSFFEAYGRFLTKVVQGDLGESFYSRREVSEIIWTAMPVTAGLVFGALVMWLLIAFPIGVISALYPRSVVDRAGMVFVLVGISAHPLWIGYILSYVFGRTLGWFPINGYCDVFYAVTACGGPVQWAYHMFLPWLTFSFLFAALYARMIRASLLEAMGEDYVRTAEAKGLGRWSAVRNHALRNAMLPIVTMLGMDVGLAFAGAVFVERVYGLPGIGNLLYNALGRHDMPVILGVVLLVTTAILIFNLIVDLLYAVLDPRIRLVESHAGRVRAGGRSPAGTSSPAPASASPSS
jgi:peptide/nickel transport system permease protein